MDSRWWNGDVDDREFGPIPLCDLCGGELYPEERAAGVCIHCAQAELDAAFDAAKGDAE